MRSLKNPPTSGVGSINKPSVLRKLEEIYSSLPSLDCQRKCGFSHCGPVKPQRIEERNIIVDTGFRFRQPLVAINNVTCPQLTEQGDCSIYESRPLICRLWGLTEALKCPYGCLPSEWVSEEEATRLMRAVYDLK